MQRIFTLTGATQQAIKDGWFYTGALGYMDQEGDILIFMSITQYSGLTETEKPVKEHKMAGTVFIIISAAAFGLMAIFAKYAYAAKLNLLTMLSLRFFIAAVVLWLAVLVKRENFRIPKTQLLALAGLGALGYGLMSTFFFSAVKLIPASITSILLYTYPVIVTLLSAWMYEERITTYKVTSLVISSVGLVMVVGAAFNGLNFLGVLCGALAAVFYSLYVVLSNKLVDKVNSLIMTTYIMTSAAIIFNIVGWSTGSVNLDISGQGWLAVFGIAVISTAVALLTFFRGMRLVGPSKASIISTIEPVITIAAAFILFAERLTLTQVAGAALVIAAVLLIQRDK